MINIAQDTIFKLHPIDTKKIRTDIAALLIEDEEVVAAFKTVRDQMIFTTHRIITTDSVGVTGVKKTYSSLPYAKIQFYGIETPGLVELVPESALMLTFASGYTARFEFRGSTDILELSRVISEYIL